MVELGIFSQGVSEGPQLSEVPERLPGKEMDIGKEQSIFDTAECGCLTPDTSM